METTIQGAYNSVMTSGAMTGTMGLASFAALIIIIWKFTEIYANQKENDKNGVVEYIKKLFQQYAKYIAFIIAFPLILPLIESQLAGMQDNINGKYSGSSDIAITQAISEHVQNYIKEEQAIDATKGIVGIVVDAVLDEVMFWKEWRFTATLSIYTFSIAALKYMYFFFVCARYLWLIMLHIVAPLAVVSLLYEKTESYFYSWVTNMIVCYLLIPFYAIANVFSETVMTNLMSSLDMNVYGVLGVIGIIVLKFAMFGVVTKKSLNLLK